MPLAAEVTIAIAVVVVLTLVAFLIAIARVLAGVQQALGTVIAAVGTIVSKTEPVAYVVDSLNGNLGKASGGLTSLLESKVGPAAAAELIASVDPLKASTAASEPDHPRIRHERASPAVALQPRGEPFRSERETPVRSPTAPPADAAPERRPHPGAGGEIRLGGRATTSRPEPS